MAASHGCGYSTGGRGPGGPAHGNGRGRGRGCGPRGGPNNKTNVDSSTSSSRPECQVCGKLVTPPRYIGTAMTRALVLRQALLAPRAWHSRLSDKLQSLGFSPSKTDVSLFHYDKGPMKMFLLVYVDDIIIASSSADATMSLLHALQADFALTDLDPLHYFLDSEVSRSPDGLYLSQ
jgi:hypothetical protein